MSCVKIVRTLPTGSLGHSSTKEFSTSLRKVSETEDQSKGTRRPEGGFGMLPCPPVKSILAKLRSSSSASATATRKRNLPQCSAKASAHSKLLKLKGNTYSTKQARHFLSAEQSERKFTLLGNRDRRMLGDPKPDALNSNLSEKLKCEIIAILASTISLIGSPACEFIQYRSQQSFIQSRQVQWDLPYLSVSVAILVHERQ
ncbi:hypothetical protein L1987_53241 [Smallanthus sonchifolius]|uniref:Uncharacterized protein n=1 Tax=Smallanthus sonchifolius TaxID=185202 RepID=A0ACB9EVZ2_9ASTR|nr:hypothetical protein L1987_53241 [Smallanthus sonchifolius]